MMWKDSYRLGVERIDEQHIELFRMTEELIQAAGEDASPEACQKALGFLKDYVLYHFRDEEAYQRSIQYDGIEAHKQEHRQFTQTVLDYEKRLTDSGFDRKVMKDLAGMVTAWLIYHVTDTDQRIVSKKSVSTGEAHFDRCVDLFSDNVITVMETMAGLDRSAIRQHTISTRKFSGSIYIELGLVGDLKGVAIFGFSKELALHLICSMTMMELTELDELVQSALCEITNIACGNSATALTQRGLACDIKPPVILQQVDGQEAAGELIDTGSGTMEVVMLLDDPAQQFLP